MSLFPKKNFKKNSNKASGSDEKNFGLLNERPFQEEQDIRQPVFYCQQAQGSPTGIISGFNNVKELYQKISECYDFEISEILYCTLNTHKINMNKLLGAQIALTDFIFVHRKGRSKEIELTKKEEALGLTITDNGNGLAFIKRIKPGSTAEQFPMIQVGDHIEKINNESLVGKRHFEVAEELKNIPQGSTFTLRLISPLQAGFCGYYRDNIGPREERKTRNSALGSGKLTLRFKARGPVLVDDAVTCEKAINAIDDLLESYLGINDAQLAARIWEISEGKKNTLEFLERLNASDIGELAFSDAFIFELWGIITDIRDGRI